MKDFCFFEKRLLFALSPYYFLKKILCFEYVIVFVFYELMIDPQPTWTPVTVVAL